MIDVIHALLPNNMDPSEGFIETFIIAAKRSFNLTTPISSIDQTEETFDGINTSKLVYSIVHKKTRKKEDLKM